MVPIDNELKKHEFIVLSQDHPNPLGIIRALGESGLYPTVIIYSGKPHIINHSKYIKELHVVSSLEAGYELLKQHYTSDEHRPFLFCTDDRAVSFIDLHFNGIKDHFHVFNAGEQGRITQMMKKEELSRLAREAGFDVPAEEVVQTGKLPQNLTYPMITKAVDSTIDGWKSESFVCNNQEELTEAFSNIRSEEILIQEFIRKKGELCLEGFSTNDGKDVFIPFQISYIRYYEDSYGHYMTVSRFADDSLRRKVEELMRRTGYNGIFEVEFLLHPDGRKLFMEINFRPSAWNYAIAYGGGNLPYYWAASTLLGRIPYEDISLRDTYTAMLEPDDFTLNVLHGHRVKLSEWLKEWKDTDCYYLFNRKDPMPFWGFWIHKCCRFIGKKLSVHNG